ncbi:response regulator [Thiohalomonas denitrificans]|uniref:Putative two-component system response regulator n=1 Tax=Thiohalomonas denitrificans TaxID=415747 RepID=A0A1G5PJC3_9GAMM|nr:HD domain-containing phosphohydrolase [Thiohalomonas denitrificans]SCZ49613.1 putative two-component system response regulator [Thiohalomonas denitrificans]
MKYGASSLAKNNSIRNRLLLVDDDPGNLTVLGNLLQPQYDVLAAPTGERALQIAAGARKPDLILLDVMMPDLDGYAVLARLRADPATRDIPVIFVTGLNAIEDEEKGLELGAVDYITKPFRPSIVLARLHTQLELKRARDWLSDQNAFLEAEVERRMHDILVTQDVTISALAELAETRDKETGNHIRRTQEYVRILAERLRTHPRFSGFLTDKTITLLYKSAPLHDIGKVGIPDHILLKPGKLTEAERAVIQTHAQLGAEAIERALRRVDHHIDFLDFARQIAHWHHEKWDGSGYPDRLAGDAIPVPARLMALADVFDALISCRVYKAALPAEQVRDIIVGERGKHFDPDITDAFLDCFDAFVAAAARFRDKAMP